MVFDSPICSENVFDQGLLYQSVSGETTEKFNISSSKMSSLIESKSVKFSAIFLVQFSLPFGCKISYFSFESTCFLLYMLCSLWWIFSDIYHCVKSSLYLSIFNPNLGKYGPEKLWIRTLFTQCTRFNILLYIKHWPLLMHLECRKKVTYPWVNENR